MVIAGVSQWTMTVGRAWLVFELSGSAFAVALVTFSGMVGTFVMTPLGGVLADRKDRRVLLRISMMAPLIVTLLLAGLTVSDTVDVWHVVALSFAANLVQSMGQPASRALTPSYVPAEHLLNAVSLRNAAMRGPRLFGPLLAAPLLASIGPEGVFFAAAILYSLASANLLKLPRVELVREGVSTSMVSDFAEGVRYVTRVSPVNIFVGLVATHCAMTMAFDSLLPSLASDALDGGSSLFSYLFMAVGAGGLAAALAMASVRGFSVRGNILLATGLMSGLSLIIVAVSPTAIAAMVGLALAGGSQAAFMSLTEVMLVETVPDRLRGRAMGVYTMNNTGLMAVFALVNGYVADLWEVQNLFLVLGLMFVVFAIVTFALSGKLRLIYRSGALASAQAVPA